jgi:hypothetical protein
MLNTVLKASDNERVYVVDLAPGLPAAGPTIEVTASKTASLNRVHRVSYIGSAPVTLDFPSGSKAGDRISVFMENIGMGPSTFTVTHMGVAIIGFSAPLFSQQFMRFEWSSTAWILS